MSPAGQILQTVLGTPLTKKVVSKPKPKPAPKPVETAESFRTVEKPDSYSN